MNISNHKAFDSVPQQFSSMLQKQILLIVFVPETKSTFEKELATETLNSVYLAALTILGFDIKIK
jgi:hypothetical protein